MTCTCADPIVFGHACIKTHAQVAIEEAYDRIIRILTQATQYREEARQTTPNWAEFTLRNHKPRPSPHHP